jgi:hypothetical protein
MKILLALCALAASTAVAVPVVQAIGSNHPDCPGLVSDLGPGATPVAGEVWIKAGDDHVSVGFQEAGYIIPETFQDKEVSHADVCPDGSDTTTTAAPPPPPPPPSSTTTTTTVPGETTTPPPPPPPPPPPSPPSAGGLPPTR